MVACSKLRNYLDNFVFRTICFYEKSKLRKYWDNLFYLCESLDGSLPNFTKFQNYLDNLLFTLFDFINFWNYEFFLIFFLSEFLNGSLPKNTEFRYYKKKLKKFSWFFWCFDITKLFGEKFSWLFFKLPS